jgi:hypothetical protein
VLATRSFPSVVVVISRFRTSRNDARSGFTTFKQKKKQTFFMNERELIEELIKLQITQTATLTRLLESNIARTPNADEKVKGKTKKTKEVNENRPLEIGDSVILLTPGRFRVKKGTVCIVVKIGARVTVETPSGTKIVRAAHNLQRVSP